MPERKKVIEVHDLKKSYGGFEALRGLSFDVYAGEIFGILGPNGAGKTTTLEIIEGLKAQSSGSIKVLDFDNHTDEKEIKNKIGVQLQSSEYLHYLTLAELIKLFASLYKNKVDPIAELSKVGLADKAGYQVKELSGGQKQRFTIATALLHKPEIIFLDEPTTGLDPQARREMWQLIKGLNAEGMSIVLTTHYMEEAEYLCDRVAIMERGKILKLDSPEGLIESLSTVYKLSFFVERPLGEDFFEEFKKNTKDLMLDFPKVIVEINDIEVLPKIIQKLKTQKIVYKFLNLQTAKLEDVYLHLTGREYSE